MSNNEKELDQLTSTPITQDEINRGLFPFDAFEFDDPLTTETPRLWMKSPWAMVAKVALTSSTKVVSSTNYTILDNDAYTTILVTTGNSDRTITLPTATDNQFRLLCIGKADTGSGKVIIDGEGAELVNGAATYDLLKQFDFTWVTSTGTEWMLLTTDLFTLITKEEGQSGYVDAVSGGTKTPTQVVISKCEGLFRAITLTWSKQLNLTNFDHYEIQVSDDESSWYSLELDGTDWKDTLNETTDVDSEYFLHTDIPLGGTEASPTTVTLYYRIRRVTKAPANGTWSANASATLSGINVGDIVADAITNAKIATDAVDTTQIKNDAVQTAKILNDAITTGKILNDAITSNKIVAGAVTTAKLYALAVTSAKIDALAITVGKIAANAVQTQNLSVIARELINNISQTKVLNGWGGILEDGSGSTSIMSLVDATVNGAVTKVLRIFNSGNRSIRSKTFPVNHDKIYRYTIWLKKNSTEGLIYLGLSAFDEVNEGYEGSDSGPGDKLIKLYNASTRAYSSENANSYFHLAFDQTVWTEYTTYIVGANRDVNDCPQHKLCTYIAKLGSDTTDVAIRILNWGNISSRTLDLCSPSITEVGAGQIVAENIVAGSIIASKIDTDAIEAVKIKAGAVTADKITAATIQTLLLKAAYIWVGFAGSGTYDSPNEGDRRIYVDDDEITFMEYAGGAWSSVNQIKLGGVDSNSLFYPFLQCRGVLNPQADEVNLEFFPGSDFRVFNFDNDYEDQHGVDDWVSKGFLAFSSAIKKFGTHSLWATDTHVGLLKTPSTYWSVGESQATGGWFYASALSVSVGLPTHYYRYSTTDTISVSIFSNKIIAGIIKGSTSTNKTITIDISLDTWHYIGLIYDSSLDKLYITIDDEIYSWTTFAGTWNTGNTGQLEIQTALNFSGITLYVDEVLFAPDQLIDPDIFVQHYNHNIAWNTDASTKDLILRPASGGRLSWTEPGAGYNPVSGEPSLGTLHLIKAADRSSSYDLNDGSVSTTWESVDLSALVPAGTKAVFGYIYIHTTSANDQMVLLTREGGSADTNTTRTRTIRLQAEIGASGSILYAGLMTIMAPDGQFDYREFSATFPVDTLLFLLWGYYI